MEWTQFTLSGLGQLSTFLLIVIFVALFVAANPRIYHEGMLRLVPLPSRTRAREIIDRLGETMRWWLMGQVLAMIMTASRLRSCSGCSACRSPSCSG